MRFRFHPDALEELDTAAGWYEQEREGLGADMIAAVDEAIASIAELPDAFPLLPGSSPGMSLRRCRLRRFPYSVVYLHSPEEILLVAVAHARRKPGYWRSRVRK